MREVPGEGGDALGPPYDKRKHPGSRPTVPDTG